jgi:hypothetical protein
LLFFLLLNLCASHASHGPCALPCAATGLSGRRAARR